MTTDVTPRPRRTFIFSPGLEPGMFPKAVVSGTDIVCVELEDGVAPKDKDLARERALAIFADPQARALADQHGVEQVVRINSVREQFGLADVAAVLASDTPPPVLMLPKAARRSQVLHCRQSNAIGIISASTMPQLIKVMVPSCLDAVWPLDEADECGSSSDSRGARDPCGGDPAPA